VHKLGYEEAYACASGKREYRSAYMLFYVQNGYEHEGLRFDSEIDVADRLDLRAVNQENDEFKTMQAVFQPAVSDFVQEVGTVDLNLQYLFNILSHSKVSPSKLREFCDHLVARAESQNYLPSILQFFIEKFDQPFEIIRCASENITEPLLCFISRLHSPGTIELSVQLCNLVIDSAQTVITSFRGLPRLFRIVMDFLNSSEEARAAAVGWFDHKIWRRQQSVSKL